MLVDTHAHLISECYEDIDDIINNAKECGINKIINVSDSIETSKEVVELSKKYKDFMYTAVGIHPQNVKNFKKKDLNILEDLLKNNNILAIGEIGLDFYYGKKDKNKQIKVFIELLNLAEKYNKPVLIHVRDANDEMIKILKKYNLKGIIHCFNGSLDDAKEYIKLGYLLGIGGIVTFKKSNLKNIVKEINLENIVLETDCPYLTPEPFRSLKNEPKYIRVIGEYLASIKNITIEDLEKITNDNINRLFF